MSMTTLEKVLATELEKVLARELEKVTLIDVSAIIEAAQVACVGGCTPGANTTVPTGSLVGGGAIAGGSAGCTSYVSPTGMGEGGTATSPAKRTKTQTKEVPQPEPKVPNTLAENAAPKEYPPLAETKPEPTPTNATPTVGIDLSGLFTGSGADKKVVKTVFLAAVEKATTLAALVALNATCDCGFATGDYTEETALVLKRKLTRWGAAQG